MFKILIIATLVTAIAADYYQLLGIPRNANDAQIKKAFKKLSLKYHPDKNRDKPDQAKEHFTKIVNAYEVLKDATKRQIYDTQGEKGVKDHEAGQSQGGGNMRYEDMFQQFFTQGGGGGGGGQQFFTFTSGGSGQQHFQQQQQQPEIPEHFKNTDVFELNIGAISRFYRRKNVWIILFYKAAEDIGTLKDTWKELASKFYGIFTVAAVDCGEHEELCEDEFDVPSLPWVLVYPANIKSIPIPFKKEMKVGTLASAAIKEMESFVQFVNSENYQRFVNSSPEKKKVLLFTSKKTTPPMIKAISKEFKEKLVFGEVKASDETLKKAFGILAYPTLIVITDSENYKGEEYEGDYNKKDQVTRFLREFAYYGTEASNNIRVVEVHTLDSKSVSNHCHKGDSEICVIYTGPDSAIIERLAHIYVGDPLKFLKTDSKFNVKEVLGSHPHLFVVKGKRGRVSIYTGDMEFEKIKTYLDEVLGGSARFGVLKKGLDHGFNEQKKEL